MLLILLGHINELLIEIGELLGVGLDGGLAGLDPGSLVLNLDDGRAVLGELGKGLSLDLGDLLPADLGGVLRGLHHEALLLRAELGPAGVGDDDLQRAEGVPVEQQIGGDLLESVGAIVRGVLLGVGLVLPLVWLGMFALSLRRSAKRLGLSAEKTQYTVALSPEKIHVSNDREEADFPWGAVHGAWRVKGCIYLYVSPTRAFLLPDGANTQRAWELIEQCAPKAIR